MALELYNKKRNFGITPEPKGRVVKRPGKGLMFVIQKHRASHMHYDFRLELDGVLLSWAVPKGPSLDTSVRRLAMHVEDHPIEYGDFEGTIPPKQYGAGTVLLWDRGVWIPRGDPVEDYRRGRLKFNLEGEKLHGGWMLVRSHGAKYDQDKAWFLIKERDEYAKPESEGNIVEDEPNSVASGRGLEEIAADPDRVWHSNKSVADNVKTGAVKKKKMSSVDPATLPGAVKRPMPDLIDPELATLVKQPPAGAGWIHEMKLDGYRMLCRIENGEAHMISRSGRDWTSTFPAVARCAARVRAKTAWLDGEVVVMDAEGRTSFQALQNVLNNERAQALHYFVFDLVYLDGYDLRDVPLLERKRALESLLTGAPATLRFSGHIEGSGAEFLQQACKLKLEGMIAKRAESVYQSGRTREWLKVKCSMRQEMVIGGYTDPEGTRSGFGALLLGVYERDGTLRYSGKVGTGFNDATLKSMHKQLQALETKSAPFSNPPRGYEAKGAHWIKPELVAEIEFTEWTNDGTLRHPSFQGLRADKRATEVVRERPLNTDTSEGNADPADAELLAKAQAKSTAARKRAAKGATAKTPTPEQTTAKTPARSATAKKVAAKEATAEQRAAKPTSESKPTAKGTTAKTPATEQTTESKPAAEQAAAKKRAAARTVGKKPAATGTPATKSAAKATVEAESHVEPDDHSGATVAGIKLSNPDKMLYPESGLSKRDLAVYYETIGEWIVPHLSQRPLTLVRCPNGWNKHCFYQKHPDAKVNAIIERVTVEESNGPTIYMMANTVSAVVALLQMGALELHPFGSSAPKLTCPDRIVFDFDPDEGISWEKLVEAVHLLKTLVEEIGLKPFIKTTGGKGLHVVIPITPSLGWDEIKPFTKSIAELLERTFPDRFVSNMSKAKRRGKIFIDYLRNGEGATAVSAYSLRAREGAPVAMPIHWDELKDDIHGAHFNVRNVPERLRQMKQDPWADFFSVKQSVTRAMIQKVSAS